MIEIGFNVIYIWELIIPTLLPFILGPIVFAKFRNSELGLLSSVFVMKSGVDFLLFYVFSILESYMYLWELLPIPPTVLEIILIFLPPLFLTIIIYVRFRNFFGHWMPWLFLGFDILRWLITVGALIFETSSYGDVLTGAWFLSPSLYATFVTIVFVLYSSRSKHLSKQNQPHP